MNYTYIASPYSHKDKAVMEQRFEAVQRYTASCMAAGRCVYSPIAHNHPIAVKYELPRTWEYWKKMDLPLVARASAIDVLMLDGWRDSIGMAAEVEFARQQNLPVYYTDVMSMSREYQTWRNEDLDLLHRTPMIMSKENTWGSGHDDGKKWWPVTVKWFDMAKGFGFAYGGPAEEVFLHAHVLKPAGVVVAAPGMRFEVVCEKTSEGYKALEIR